MIILRLSSLFTREAEIIQLKVWSGRHATLRLVFQIEALRRISFIIWSYISYVFLAPTFLTFVDSMVFISDICTVWVNGYLMSSRFMRNGESFLGNLW